jgi:16S rRNA (guanine966-N2)-methyltransferase
MAIEELSMRIIAGISKGRKLAVPDSGTRPMTGRAKESVFSILSTRLSGAHVLDLYAGSGALGLEAMSRGAAGVVFVEQDRSASRIIERNIDTVGLGGSVVRRSLPGAIAAIEGTYDVVFVDPPYADGDVSVADTLQAMDEILADDGVIVLHRQARSTVKMPEFLTCYDERRYGDAVVTMLERLES